MTGITIRRWLIVALLAFLAWQWLGQRASLSPLVATPTGVVTNPTTPSRVPTNSVPSTSDSTASTPDDIADLPPEALTTLRLIASRGPFPYERDGVVFGNFEHRLPEQPRGYYHEYTVPTPGAHNRGARRIITGGDPPRSYYYTDDHYESFRQIGGQP